MSHFAHVARVPGDPILGLLDAYRADPNPAKLDLGVGVYKDAQGLTPIPRAVKLAEQRLVDSEATKTYIGGHGAPEFGASLLRLVLGEGSALLRDELAGATQAPGGTGALRLAGEFIARNLPGRGIWLSDPTWPIHETIFATCGLKVGHYPYVDADNQLQVEAMLAALAHVPKGDGVGMDQGVLARIQRFAGQQWLGERAGAGQGVNLLGQGVGGGRNQLRQRLGLREGGGLGSGVCLHPANALSATGAANRKFWTMATWSAAIKVGACPTPSNSTQRALGPRACMAWAVSGDNRSDCAPRSNSVWAWIWSYSCHNADSPAAAPSWVKARNGTAIAGS